jgi:cytochrome c oxidase cbb3-type subunit 2
VALQVSLRSHFRGEGFQYAPLCVLVQTQPIIGQGSSKALKLSGALAPAAGYEVVPSSRGEALVAYLLSLKDTYAYPETKNIYTAPAPKAGAKQEGHK